MARRFVFLDAGPLGIACNPKDQGRLSALRTRLDDWASQGSTIVIPEIADYEVRRKLLWNRSWKSIGILDEIEAEFVYLKISHEAMRLAAKIWAESRLRGRPTPDEKALDADLIFVAQARIYTGLEDRLVIITSNKRHIGPFVPTSAWEVYQPTDFGEDEVSG